MTTSVTIEPHASLRTVIFETELKQPLGETSTPEWLTDLLRGDTAAPVQRTEDLRTAVRDMLRQGGYKPTGRGKPASEYLVRAAEEGGLRPINLAVDVCNVVSLHSGFPISLIDPDLAMPPLRIAVAQAGTRFVFNASGQEIDVAGLVLAHQPFQKPCLVHEFAGAAANVSDHARVASCFR